jgi:hypothetical protein
MTKSNRRTCGGAARRARQALNTCRSARQSRAGARLFSPVHDFENRSRARQNLLSPALTTSVHDKHDFSRTVEHSLGHRHTHSPDTPSHREEWRARPIPTSDSQTLAARARNKKGEEGAAVCLSAPGHSDPLNGAFALCASTPLELPTLRRKVVLVVQTITASGIDAGQPDLVTVDSCTTSSFGSRARPRKSRADARLCRALGHLHRQKPGDHR